MPFEELFGRRGALHLNGRAPRFDFPDVLDGQLNSKGVKILGQVILPSRSWDGHDPRPPGQQPGEAICPGVAPLAWPIR
jgi:hypothetical protein